MISSRSIRLHPFVLLALFAGGCEGARQADGPLHLDDLRPLGVAEEARFGDRDDPDTGFSFVYGADVDRDGRLYVLEGSEMQFRVYSPEGAFLHRIGRGRGEGPGEFRGAPRFGVRGDTVWAADLTLNRITLFDREGRLLSTGRFERFPVPLPAAWGYLVPWMMRPDGRFVGHFAMIASGPGPPPTEVRPTDPIPWPFVLFGASGEVADTVGWAPRPPPRLWRPPSEAGPGMRFVDAEGGRHMVPSPPSRLPWWIPLEDGYIVVSAPPADDPADAVIGATRIAHSGDTIYDLRLAYDPGPWTDAELDSIAAGAARGESGGMSAAAGAGPPVVPDNWQAIARVLRGEMAFPTYKVPVTGTWLARDGTLWIRVRGEDSELLHWLLVDPDGRPRGLLALPARIRPLWAQGEILWASEPDEVDVPWVVRLRIEPS